MFCENSDSRVVIEENGFTGRQCAGCGLIFVSPRPSRREMDERYESGAAHLSPDSFISGAGSRSARAHARREVKRLSRHVAGGSLLEIGPGNGTFLVEARRAGFDVYAVELNPTQAEFIRTRHGIPCATSLDAAPGLGPERFDVIYHCDVLSHFYDPLEEFRRIKELLVLGGYHVFETGNGGDIDHKFFKDIKSFQYPDHLFFYGQRSLRELLRQTGFEHLRTYRYSILPAMLLRKQLLRLLGRRSDRSGKVPPAMDHIETRGSAGGAAHIARGILDYISYVTRYSVGALAIREHHPQTLIVVARASAGAPPTPD